MPTRTDAHLPIAHHGSGATIAAPAMAPDTLMLALAWRYLKPVFCYFAVIVTLYLLVFFAIYGLCGQWMPYKYHTYYFTGDRYFLCSRLRYSTLWDRCPRVMGYIEPIYSPILTTIEISQSNACPPGLIGDAWHLRGLFAHCNRGIVGLRCMFPCCQKISILNTSTDLSASGLTSR